MDSFTEVSQSFITNFSDREAVVKISCLPFTPEVVVALSRLRKEREHWSEGRYYDELQELMIGTSGLAIDTVGGRTANQTGWSATPQTILLYVHLLNTAWPCQNVTIIADRHTEKLFGLQSDIPCPQVEVDSIIAHITVNGAKASTVWGKRNEILKDEETLLCMFPVQSTELTIHLQ